MATYVPFTALTCPLDASLLRRDTTAWKCAAGHSFDIAREGYVNLLPVQNKRSRDPGDSKEMVAARRRFLEKDHYACIADAVAATVFQEAEPGAALSCLDAGCGEGYYLRRLAEATDSERPLQIVGLDISKWAVQAAARSDRNMAWVVGSNARLPVQDGSLDVVLCMFGFPIYAEFARVLKHGGILLEVEAGADHLRELREIIYPTVKPPRLPPTHTPAGFRECRTSTVRETVKLDSSDDIADLLAMTPHMFRANAEGRERAGALTQLDVTLDVRLNVLRRA